MNSINCGQIASSSGLPQQSFRHFTGFIYSICDNLKKGSPSLFLMMCTFYICVSCFLLILLVAYANVPHTVHTLDNFIFVISGSSFVWGMF